MRHGQLRTVFKDDHGLFVKCESGRHYLDGQRLSELDHNVSSEEDAYVGFRLG